MIPYGKHQLFDSDIEAVTAILKSDYLTQGPTVELFENKVKEYVNVNYTVAVNSATSALHITCLALGLGDGDIAWTSAISFVASANCAIYCGASIDFVDVDLSTGNMSIKALKNKLLLAKQNNKLPKVVIPVHLTGNPCEMAEIKDLSSEYGFKVIEDASHAIGANYEKEYVGSCKYSDATIFSFHPVKIISSGEGGMVATNSEETFEKLKRLRSHGIVYGHSSRKNSPCNEIWNYEQVDLGYNYRMSDIHAALGLSQMAHIEDFIISRNAKAKVYNAAFKNSVLKTIEVSNDTKSSYHLYPILLPETVDQKKIYSQLQNAGISVNIHYIPIYLQPYYEKIGFKRGYCPNAEIYFSKTITLPLYTTLKKEDQNYVINKVNEYIIFVNR